MRKRYCKQILNSAVDNNNESVYGFKNREDFRELKRTVQNKNVDGEFFYTAV